MKSVRLILAAALLLFTAARAEAKPEPVKTAGAESAPGSHVSYSNWVIEGPVIRLRFMVPAVEAQALVGLHQPLMARAKVADEVVQDLTVTSAAGDCPAIDQGEGVGEVYSMAQTPGLLRYEIVFVCPDPKGMVLHDKFLFKATPSHVNYARIQQGVAPPVLRLFTRSRQSVMAPAAGASAGPGLISMAREGASRLLKSWDALCILAALLLLALRWSDLKLIAAGLASGYAASLIAAASGLAMTRPPLAGVAAAILVVAIAGAGLRRQSASAEPAPRPWRLVGAVTAGLLAIAAGVAGSRVGEMSAMVVAGLAVFGLVLVWNARISSRPAWLILAPAFLFAVLDGMVPVSELAVLSFPTARILTSLAFYDLGALVAASLVSAAAMGLLWVAGRKLSMVRKAAADIGGAALIGLGVFWFVSRLYS